MTSLPSYWPWVLGSVVLTTAVLITVIVLIVRKAARGRGSPDRNVSVHRALTKTKGGMVPQGVAGEWEIAALRKEMTALRSEVGQLRSQVTTLETENAELRRLLDE
jgi:cell division protein FtsB